MERNSASRIVVALGMGLFAASAPALADRPSVSGFYVGTGNEFEAGSGIIDTFDAQLDVDDDGGPVIMTLFAQTRPDDAFHDIVVNDDLSFTALNSNDSVVTGNFSGNQVTLSICLQAPECEDHIEFTGSRTPHGACCLPGGGCTFDAEDFCTSNGGVYHGDDTTCEDVSCTESAAIRWTNPAGGDFATGSNWEAQRAPTASDNAIVDLGGAFPINFSDAATALKLAIQNTSVDLFGGTLTLLGNSELLASLALSNNAEVALRGGAIICAGDVDIGDVPGGALAALELLGDNTGGTIPALSTPGRISVGFLAPGRLQVTNGTLTCDTLAFGTPSLGDASASNADFEGAFSRSNSADQVILGQSGPSTLTIGGGARLQSLEATLGAHSSGKVVVQGAGFPFGLSTPSAWTVNSLAIGDAADGTLEIRDGASVNSAGSPDRYQVGSGSILVTGASESVGSSLTTGTLEIGTTTDTASASMTVEAGGEVILGDSLTIGVSQAPATVTVQTGGRIQTNQLRLGSDSQPVSQTELSRLSVTGQPSDASSPALTVTDAATLGGANAQLTLSAGAHANFNNGLEISPTGRAVLQALDANTFGTVSGLMKVAGKSASAAASVVVQDGAAVSKPSDESADLQVGDPDSGGAGDLQITHPSSGASDSVTAQMLFDNVNLLLGKISVAGAGKLIARDHLNVFGGELDINTDVADFADVKCDTLAVAAAQTPATVTIQNGGKILATNLSIGSDGSAAGAAQPSQLNASATAQIEISGSTTMTGANSTINLSSGAHAVFIGGLNITPSGTATLNASDPNTFAVVQGTMIVAGTGPSAIAAVNVTNGAVVSKDTQGNADLVVGSASGGGLISIQHPLSGFQDSVPAQMFFNNVEIKDGIISVTDAGRCGAISRFTVDAGCALNVNSNLLDFNNVLTDTLVIKAGGVVRCCPSGRIKATTIVNEVGATIQGDAHVVGNVVTSGLVRVGCSPGLMTIEGDYQQSDDGTLQIEIAGLGDGEFDVLNVTGDVTLGGTIEVHFLDGFLPAAGDSVDFLQVGGNLTGDFSQISFPELAEGFRADLNLTSDGKLRLTARTDAVAGDGTSITPPAELTAPDSASADGAPAPGCGSGLCGAGTLPMIPLMMVGLSAIKLRLRNKR